MSIGLAGLDRSLGIAAALFLAGSAHAEWTLDEDLLPEALSLELQHRTRYELLDDQFRSSGQRNSDVVALRTLLHARVALPFGLAVGAELADSRSAQDQDTLLNTSIVNPVELLRAYAEWEREDFCGGLLALRGGRITLDVGSRRFVARNRFRNTINAFTGIDAEWNGPEERGSPTLRAFWTLPIQRRPTRPGRLRSGDVVFDEESTDVQLWGLFGARDLPWIGRGELYVFGLHERDSGDRPTLNRQLATPGFRTLRSPKPGHFDYVLENAIQFGSSRRSTTSSGRLDHLAHFHHLTLGYTFDAPWKPRVALQYDYASGDREINDGKHQRFDTLFGARRFDFGPTSIYGPFARSNLHTPGVRLQLEPHDRVGAFAAYRGYWLASKEDAWTAASIIDPTGSSGSFIGSQLELRVRWQLIPVNLRLETGYAHLFSGRFIDEAPGSPSRDDSDYFYVEIELRI